MQVSSYLKLSVLVAVVTIVLKTAAWWTTGSVSLLSDALESLVNLAGAMFALAMVTLAALPPDDKHPYGHHKAEYFSSGFEGILIFVAALAIIVAAVQRWLHPQPIESLGLGLALSMFSSALNGALAWAMLRKAREHRSMALEGDARHLFTDVWTSVGVGGGLIAVHLTGWIWLDPLIAILVALNILREGASLVWRSADGLMDHAVEADVAESNVGKVKIDMPVEITLDALPELRLRGTSGLKIIDGPENRTIFFGMDVASRDLKGDNVEGKNPLADKKVRQAMNMAATHSYKALPSVLMLAPIGSTKPSTENRAAKISANFSRLATTALS